MPLVRKSLDSGLFANIVQMLGSNVRAGTIAKKFKISLFSFAYSTRSQRYLKILHTTKCKYIFYTCHSQSASGTTEKHSNRNCHLLTSDLLNKYYLKLVQHVKVQCGTSYSQPPISLQYQYPWYCTCRHLSQKTTSLSYKMKYKKKEKE